MSMIPCPECKTPVSDSAPMCPTCGFQVSAWVKSQQKSRRNGRILGAFLVFIAVAGVLGLITEKITEYNEEQDRIAKKASEEQERKDDIEKIKKDPGFYLDKTEKLVSVFGDYDKAKPWMSKLEEAIPEHPRMKPLRKEYEKLKDEKDSIFGGTFGSSAEEKPKPQKWYVGGTLHKSTLAQWAKADERNKLATSADIAVKAYQMKKKSIPFDLDKMKTPATAIMKCIDEPAKEASLGTQTVAEIAVGCIVLLKL